MKFPGYFLIVWDFIRYAKEHGIPVGPGRGSAAGSLVSYALGITDIDPIQHELLFERFLNPERVSMPDIDIDFCMNRRGEVIHYVTQKYGRDNVAQIVTFGTMAARLRSRCGPRDESLTPTWTGSRRWSPRSSTSPWTKPSPIRPSCTRHMKKTRRSANS